MQSCWCVRRITEFTLSRTYSEGVRVTPHIEDYIIGIDVQEVFGLLSLCFD